MLNFFLEHKNSADHKKLTKKNNVYFIGGTIFLIGILFLYKFTFLSFIFLSIYLLGLFSDINKLTSPKLRFIIQIFIVISAVIFYDVSITSTKIVFIDELLKFKLFQIFFSCFCLMVLINGSNFIDGVNLNLVGYYIIVLITIIFLSSNIDLLINFNLIYSILLILSLIYLLNSSGKFISGDSGAYTYGIFFGIFMIQFSNDNPLISPIFIALLLWYPAFENLFSIIRRMFYQNKKIDEPDNFHLHHLIFLKINHKFKNNYLKKNATGVIIILYNFLIFLIGKSFLYSSIIQIYLILFSILLYTSIYWLIIRKNINK